MFAKSIYNSEYNYYSPQPKASKQQLIASDAAYQIDTRPQGAS